MKSNGDRTAGRKSICLCVLLYFSAAQALSEETQTRPSLHTFDLIMKIMEDSKLVYEIDLDEKLPPQTIGPTPGLSDQAYLREGKDGEMTLTTFTLSDEAARTLKQGEEAFRAKDYDLALKLYQEVQALEPEYHHLQALMGDVSYMKGDYEQAKSHYEEALRHNFADYQAHWFLADANWKLGDKKATIKEITTAHLLNRNHDAIKKVLLSYREKIGRPWKPWEFSPRYALTRDRENIKVVSGEEWIGYAAVKAVWKYEPDYARNMAGPDYEQRVVIMEEEKEALVAYLGQKHPMKELKKILAKGFINEFIYYELLAPRAPTAMALFPRESFNRIVNYIDKYH